VNNGGKTAQDGALKRQAGGFLSCAFDGRSQGYQLGAAARNKNCFPLSMTTFAFPVSFPDVFRGTSYDDLSLLYRAIACWISLHVGNLNCVEDVHCSAQGQDRAEAAPTAPALAIAPRRESQGMRPWTRPGRTSTSVNGFWRLSQASQARRATIGGPITPPPCAGSHGPCHLHQLTTHKPPGAYCRPTFCVLPQPRSTPEAGRPIDDLSPLSYASVVRVLTPHRRGRSVVRTIRMPADTTCSNNPVRALCCPASKSRLLPPGWSLAFGERRTGMSPPHILYYAESRPLDELHQTVINRA
jgi:hypothetical protein